MLLIITFLVLLTITLAVHEYGHAVAMKASGIRIKEMGLGFPVPKFMLRFPMPGWPGTEFVISPLLIGAYVSPVDEDIPLMEALPYRDKAHIFGSGVWANLMFASALAVLTYPFLYGWNEPTLKFMGIYVAVFSALWVFKRGFCSYVIPVLSVLMVSLLLFGLYIVLFVEYPNETVVKGPIGIISEAATKQTLEEVIGYTISLSLNFAFLNMIPLVPMDGGKYLSTGLSKISPTIQGWVDRYGAVTFLLLILLVLTNDVKNLF